MEFDILNELLTKSVAQLFTDNQQKHQNILKTSTQMGQDKREIPRQSSGLSNLMQTPEKNTYGSNELVGNSGPSPTGEKLSQILSGGSFEQHAQQRNNPLRYSQEAQPKNGQNNSFDSFNNLRGGSNGSRTSGPHNVSQ
jgi:hypothetical protein